MIALLCLLVGIYLLVMAGGGPIRPVGVLDNRPEPDPIRGAICSELLLLLEDPQFSVLKNATTGQEYREMLRHLVKDGWEQLRDRNAPPDVELLETLKPGNLLNHVYPEAILTRDLPCLHCEKQPLLGQPGHLVRLVDVGYDWLDRLRQSP